MKVQTVSGAHLLDVACGSGRVCSLSNLECVGETLRAVLDDLATLAPDWLAKQISPD